MKKKIPTPEESITLNAIKFMTGENNVIPSEKISSIIYFYRNLRKCFTEKEISNEELSYKIVYKIVVDCRGKYEEMHKIVSTKIISNEKGFVEAFNNLIKVTNETIGLSSLSPDLYIGLLFDYGYMIHSKKEIEDINKL